MGWPLLKTVCWSVHSILYFYIISRNHSNTFSLIKMQKTKTLEGLFVLISDIWQFRHYNFSWCKLILRKFMLHQENLVFVCSNTRGGVHYYIEWFLNNKKKVNIFILHAVEMYKNVESINTQNDYRTLSEKWTDKKKTVLFFVFCKFVWIPRKQVQDHSKEFLGNKNISKKEYFWEKPPLTVITTW